MAKKAIEILQEQAKIAGYDNVDDYLTYCEVLTEVKKMNAAFDRALMPDDLMKYCDPATPVVYRPKNNG